MKESMWYLLDFFLVATNLNPEYTEKYVSNFKDRIIGPAH